MNKREVKVGHTYRAKVTDKVVRIRIDATHPDGGWKATNLETNRKIRIKSAQRLRHDDWNAAKNAAQDKQNLKAVAKADQENARLRDERARSADGMTASERAMSESAPAAKKHAAVAAKAKPQRLSCLDAAAQVLAEADEPMNCKAMIEAIFAKSLWTTDAPTPEATLYSAILREMKNKGDDARFRKVARGQFELAKEAS